MANLDLEWKKDISTFRRIAIGTWETPYDPSVYGTLELRMDAAMAYIAAFRERYDRRITVTHLMAKATAMAFREMPDANAVLRWNRVYLRKDIGVFFQVAMTDEGPGRTDLSGATLHHADTMDLITLHDTFKAKVDAVRARKDPALEQTRGVFKHVPGMLLNPLLKLMAFASYTLNLDLRALGVPRDAFGSVMITNIGSLGLDQAWVPLVPYARVPMLLATGAIRDTPVAEDGMVQIRKVMKVNATFDHRFIDGVHAAVMARVLRAWIEHPFEHFDPL